MKTMKALKKIISFVIAFSLLLSMAPFAFATELTEVKAYQLDMPFNSDFIGKIGQEVDPATWQNGINTNGDCSNFSGLNGNLSYLKEGNANYIAPNGVTFKLSPETFDAKVPDAWNFKVNANNLSVNGSKRPASKLYVLYMTNGGSNTLNVTMKFTDGTSNTVKVNFPNNYYTSANNYSDIAATYSNLGGYMRPVMDEETNILVDTNKGETDLNVMSIAIPENKIVESYSFADANTNIFTFFGMSEVALSNEELKAAVAIDLSTATDDEIRFAKACATELNTYRNDTTDYSAIEDMVVLNTVDSYPLDLPYDAEVVAPKGSEIDTSYYLGGVERETFIEEGPFTPSGIAHPSFPETFFKDYTFATASTDANNAAKSEELKADVLADLKRANAKFADNISSAKTKDAIYRWLDDGKGTITFNGSGRPSDRILIAYLTGNNYASVKLTLKYTDGTPAEKTFFPKGYYSGWGNATQWAQYVGNKPVGSNRYLYADEDGVVYDPGTDDSIYVMLSFIDLEPGKVIDTIGIGGNAHRDGVAILAMTEMALTNAELKAGATINDFATATDSEIIFAKECADELVLRGDKASNYQAVYNAYADIEYRLSGDVPEFIYADLSSQFDADMIAKVGDQPGDNWVGGIKEYGRFAALNGDKITHTDGIISLGSYRDYSDCEIIYDENGTITGFKNPDGTIAAATSKPTYESVERKIQFKLVPETFSGSVNDALDLGTAKTIQLSGRPINELWFAFAVSDSGYNAFDVEVEYADGTTGKLTVSAANVVAGPYYDGGAYVVQWLNSEMVNWKNYGKAGSVQRNTETGLVEAQSADVGTGFSYVGKHVYANKGIKSIKIPARNQTLLAAVTEIPVATDVLTAYVDEVISEIKVVRTAEETQKVALANEYAEELLKRHIYRATDEKYAAVKRLYNQVEYAEDVYIDISASGLDTDVIVPKNASILKSEYKGREDAIVGNTNVYDASVIPDSGVITMVAPTQKHSPLTVNGKEYATGYDGYALTDATFKLSGAYKGFGEDAILVAAEDSDGVTVNFSEAEQRKYKDMYFLLDSPRGDSIPHTPSVKVKINFEDGTSMETSSLVHYNRSYYNPSFYAHKALGYTALEFKEETDGADTILTTSTVTSGDSMYFFASGIKQKKDETTGEFSIPEIPYKNVTSITFMPYSSQLNYTILAVTAVPYDVEKLESYWYEAQEEWYNTGKVIVKTEEVEGNDAKLEKGAKALVELYRDRKAYEPEYEEDYAYMYEEALLIINEVEKARQLCDVGFKTELSISAAGGKVKATAVVTNGTIEGKDVVLVVAVYGENNKLLELNATPVKTFAEGTVKEEIDITCDDHDDAVSYAAFAWQSLDSLRPISYTTQPK